MSNVRLTQCLVDALSPRRKPFDVRDTELKGFGVRVRSSGTMRYFVQGQHKEIRIWRILGDAADLTLEEARRRARSVLASLHNGDEVIAATGEETRFGANAEKLFASCGRGWKDSTRTINRYYLKNQILPWFRDMQVAEINRRDVRQWHASLHATPVTADRSVPVLIPAVVVSVIGAYAVSSLLSDTAFERVFGILMVPLLILSLKPPKARSEHITWPMWLTVVVFFLIGAYGGAFQAGVGLVLVLALSHAGLDLVNANAVKVVVIAVLTVVAVPVFILNDQVHWGFALIVAAGFAVGGWLGARWAVRSGERLIRPVLAVAVLGLAGRLIGLY